MNEKIVQESMLSVSNLLMLDLSMDVKHEAYSSESGLFEHPKLNRINFIIREMSKWELHEYWHFANVFKKHDRSMRHTTYTKAQLTPHKNIFLFYPSLQFKYSDYRLLVFTCFNLATMWEILALWLVSSLVQTNMMKANISCTTKMARMHTNEICTILDMSEIIYT